MATLKDLSAHLGLSVTQVSRALNGYSDVSEKTRKRVEEAAKELEYQPNLSARKLARGRSGMVAIVRRYFPEITKDPMFLDVVTGLSLEFAKRDMQLVLHLAPRENDAVDLHRKLYAGGAIDGFVLLEPFVDDERIDYLKAANVPFVVHGRTTDEPDYAFFDINNEAVGYELTKHLLDLGHRRIALLNGFEGRGYNNHRRKGYLKALEEAGVAVQADFICHERMTESYGRQKTLELFALTEKPTALICGHVRVAKGVYEALHELGLKIPEDVSVVAHDDAIADHPADSFEPSMTVSSAAIQHSWVPLGDFMDRAIRGDDPKELQEIENIELVVRQSSAPIKEDEI